MNKKFLNVLKFLIILVCFAVIGYEGAKIYEDQKEYTVADSEYEDIRSGAVTWPSSEDESEIVGYPLITVDFDELEKTNSDFVAWIYFPALDISYPVVKEKEIDQYVNKTFEGKYNKAGCLFEDILSDENFCGRHDIIFGHNMKNGSMFGVLKQLYKKGNEEVLKDNPYIYIYTRTNVYKYQVYSYYGTTVGSQAYMEVNTDAEYKAFSEFTLNNSNFQEGKNIDLSQNPGILTLSTCSGQSGSGRRFVVHAAKVESYDQSHLE